MLSKYLCFTSPILGNPFCKVVFFPQDGYRSQRSKHSVHFINHNKGILQMKLHTCHCVDSALIKLCNVLQLCVTVCGT